MGLKIPKKAIAATGETQGSRISCEIAANYGNGASQQLLG